MAAAAAVVVAGVVTFAVVDREDVPRSVAAADEACAAALADPPAFDDARRAAAVAADADPTYVELPSVVDGYARNLERVAALPRTNGDPYLAQASYRLRGFCGYPDS